MQEYVLFIGAVDNHKEKKFYVKPRRNFSVSTVISRLGISACKKVRF